MLAHALCIACALPLACAHAQPTRNLHPGPLPAEFRGCDAAGSCHFVFETSVLPAVPPHRVRPDGVPHGAPDDIVAIAVRDRLNALMSSMIHQHKRIVLHDLRALGDGSLAARITVNEADVARDPVLLELGQRVAGTGQ
ncbi:MAG: hypothetical protein WDZ63_00155 [Burkholderiales bacterium]